MASSGATPSRDRPIIDRLEPRIMLDGAGPTAASPAGPGSEYLGQATLPALARAAAVAATSVPGLGDATHEALGAGQGTGRFQGYKWFDADLDGIRDAGEAGLAGWKVFVDTDLDGAWDSFEPYAVTGADGHYELDVAPGTYTLTEELPPGWQGVFPGWFYAINESDETVYRFDYTDPFAIEVGPVGYRVHYGGLAFNTYGAIDEPLYASKVAGDSLATVDLLTGAATVVGADSYYAPEPLAWVNGVLYGFDYDFGLGTVNTATGDFTPLFGMPTPMIGADFDDSNGILYTLSEDNALYRVDVATGAATRIGGTGVDFRGEGGLAYNPADGQLYALGNDQVEGADNLYRISRATGAATLVANTHLDEPGSLEHVLRGPPGRYRLTVAASEEIAADFGNWSQQSELGRIRGTKWRDLNGNGVRDGDDPPLGGWQVYADLNDNGQLDDGEPFGITAADGSYEIVVEPREHAVREVVQEYWRQTFPGGGGGHAVTVAPGDIVSDRDFGNEFLGGWIEGAKWHDADRDGIRDAGEIGLSGWTIYADLNDNGQLDEGEPFNVTDAAGAYSLNVPPGTHTIAEVPRPDWIQTFPGGGTHNVTVGELEVSGGVDFGNDDLADNGSIAGLAWDDWDGDAVRDAGEPAMAALTVYLDLNCNGAQDPGEPAEVTGADGSYLFGSVAAGTYRVGQVLPELWWQTSPVLTFVQRLRNGDDGVNGLYGACGVAVSGDGANVYVTGLEGDSLVMFRRNLTTGALTYLGFFRDGVNGVDGLDGASDVAVSPDGANVYVTGGFDDAVAMFARNPATGLLTYLGSLRDGVNGVDGLNGAHGLAVSPDGAHLYACAYEEGALAAFSRDPVTGLLTYLDSWFDGADGVDGLWGAYTVAVTGDGTSVYVTGYGDSALAMFRRDPGTGDLTYLGCLRDGLEGVDGLYTAAGLAVSPDGANVYTTGFYDNGALSTFRRDATTGILTYLVCIHVWDGAEGLSQPSSVTVSPGGDSVYVTGHHDGTVVLFTRHPATGMLTYVGFRQDGWGADGLGGAAAAAVSPDGAAVYVAGKADGAVSVLRTFGHVVTVHAGAAVTGRDFGNDAWPGSIAGSAWLDRDGNGAWDAGEPPQVGLTVYLDLDADGQVDVDEPTQVTGADGRYLFQTVEAGTVRVAEVLPDNWWPTAPPEGYREVLVPPDTAVTEVDFGNDALLGSVAGRAWRDRDGNGAWDAGEPPMSGVAAYLDLNFNGLPDGDDPTQLTGADGSYRFENLDPGRYRVAEVVPERWSQTWPQVSYIQYLRGGAGGGELDGITGTAVSPDGLNLYVTAPDDDAVGIFARDPASGLLTHLGSVRDWVGDVRGLDGAWDLAVSPDGANVYVTASGDLVMFSRDPDTGMLGYLGAVDVHSHPKSVAVSPDGANVYVVTDTDYVDVFSRDPATGLLTYLGYLYQCQYWGYGVTVSPDGAHVYTTGCWDNAVSIFQRDLGTGLLTYLGRVHGGSAGADGQEHAYEVIVSGDGAHVYVTSYADDSVGMFQRDPGTGMLTFLGTLRDGVDGVDGLDGAWGLNISPDGRTVYATGFRDNALAVFSRAPDTGLLTYVGLLRDGVGGVDGLAGPREVAVSPDGTSLYVAGHGDYSVTALRFGVHFVTAPAGTTVTDVDFGNYAPPGSIAGAMWHDRDGDGAWDDTEPPLVGRTVYLDLDTNGTLDAGEPTRITGHDGSYKFESLDFGTWRVAQVLPEGWWPTAPAAGWRDVEVVPADHVTGVNLGDDATPGSIAGSKWHDADGDGVRDADEPPIAGATVYLDLDGNGALDDGEPVRLTGADGGYLFENVEAGSYRVGEVVPEGWFQTWPMLSFTECLRDGAGGVDGMDGATEVAITADGANAYVAACGESAVAMFSRDALTGRLRYQGAVRDEDVGDAERLKSVNHVAVTAEGYYLYFTSNKMGGAVGRFRRDPATGLLTFKSCWADGGGAADYMGGAKMVVLTPDDAGLYVVASRESAVTMFTCNKPTGGLIYEAVAREGVDGVDGLNWVNAAAVSPDGMNLYATSLLDRSVAMFARNPVNNRLTYMGRLKDALGEVDGLIGAAGVVVSPDGMHVYVAGAHEDAVAIFDRDPATGALAYATCFRGDLATPTDLVFSADGRTLYATGLDRVSVLARNPATGMLTCVGARRDGVDGIDGLHGPNGLALGPGDAQLYVSAGGDDSVAVFQAGGHLVEVAPGQAVTGIDFADDELPATVSGRLWYDRACDGLPDGDWALSGWRVYLDLDGNRSWGPPEPSAMSDAEGRYQMLVAPGDYTIAVEEWSAGLVYSRGGGTVELALTAGGVTRDMDFALVKAADATGDGTVGFQDLGVLATNYGRSGPDVNWPQGDFTGDNRVAVKDLGVLATHYDRYLPGRVVGSVWEDLSGDGRWNDDEPGLAGRRVFADADGDGAWDAAEPCALTDAEGAWSIELPPGGPYTIIEEAAPGWQPTYPGLLYTIDAAAPYNTAVINISPVTGAAAHVPLGPCGYPPGLVDLAWHGQTLFVSNIGEDGQALGTVDLTLGAATLVAPQGGEVAAMFSFRDYLYGFELDPFVPASRYGRIDPANGKFTKISSIHERIVGAAYDAITGVAYGLTEHGRLYTFDLVTGAASMPMQLGANFGGNADLACDPRTGKLYLLGADSAAPGQPAGLYEVNPYTGALTLVARPGPAMPGGLEYVPRGYLGGQGRHVRGVRAGETVGPLDFGGRGPCEAAGAGGTVWHDADADGARGPDEAGLTGWTVFADLDSDGELDDGEPATVSTSDGEWYLSLAPGSYTIAQQVLPDWEQTYPPGGTHTVVVEAGLRTPGIDFGNVPLSGTIEGRVWYDELADGVWGGGESALEGYKVYLDANDSGQWEVGEPFDLTDATGAYGFGVTPGAHVVALDFGDEPFRWRMSPPGGRQSVSVAAGQTVTDVNFGCILLGDATGDGVVDYVDLGIFATNYGRDGMTWTDGDFTGNGLVDVNDLGWLATNYDRSI